MKHPFKLITALAIFTAAQVYSSAHSATPVAQLEVGQSYVFENASAKNTDSRYIADIRVGDVIKLSKQITNNCVWEVESVSKDGAIALKNSATGGYLFIGSSSNSWLLSRSSAAPINLYIFNGENINNTLGLSISPNKADNMFLTGALGTGSFNKTSEWYAYESSALSIPDVFVYVECGKVSYRVMLNEKYAIASGLVSGNISFDGLELADVIWYNGESYPVTEVCDEAFSGISALKGNLVLGKNINKIGACAFQNCSGFSGELVLPESIQSIGVAAFSGCGGFTGSLKFPDSVSSIGASAFTNCKGFTGSLILPQFLKVIGDNAFFGCKGFTGSLELPESITSIGSCAFEDCAGFTGSIKIPDLVTELKILTFRGCTGLNGTLVLPESIHTIWSNVFDGPKFNKVICYAMVPPSCGGGVFSRKDELQVPTSAISTYLRSAPWNEFKNVYSIEPLSGIEFAEANVVCPLGGTVKLKVNKIPFGASGEISFMSSNAAVATVDADGVVTGVAKGSAAIIAMSGTLTATCVVSVEDPTVAATDLEFEGIVGKVGESLEVRAKVVPEDVTDPTISWISSNPEVAAVDGEGTVWFNAAGSAVVTAECQGHEFSVPFIVEEVVARGLNVFPVEAVGGIGHQFSLLALHEPENTTDKSVIWESSDPNVAAVSPEGHVELKALGTAQITARSGEHTAACAVSVGEIVKLTEMASTGVVIDVVEGGIVVRNVASGESIAVYTVDGKVTNGAIVEDEETKLNLAAGIYIVKVSPATVAKVLVK